MSLILIKKEFSMQHAIQCITHEKNHRLIEIPEQFANQLSVI